jgi:hypothetical protein
MNDPENMEQRTGVPQVPFLGPGKARLRSRGFGTIVLLLAAAVAVAPLLFRGASCGHDFDFHLTSWLDAQQSWRQGLFYPHWTPSANFGAGEPRFVFYPPLTWMLGAALGLFFSWTQVPLALTFLLLAATGLATRTLARLLLDEAPATLAGCAAIFSGYTLFTAYERTAFAELTGGFWIPLLLFFALRERRASGSVWQRAWNGSTLPLALILCGAWLSNAPVGVMASYLLAAIALASALLSRSWAPLLRAFPAAILGIALSAFYLIPASWEQRWIDILQATGDPNERVENNWLFAHHADPSLALFDLELRRVSILAVSMIAVACIGGLIAWKRGALNGAARRLGILLALIPLAVLLLQLPFSLPLWNLLPKLRFLQFPWRWLVVLEAPMGIFFAAAVWSLRRWLRPAAIALSAAFFLAATVFAARVFFQPCAAEESISSLVNVYRSGAGFFGTYEYAPLGADNTEVATGLPPACLAETATSPLGALPPGAPNDSSVNPVWNGAQGSCRTTFAVQQERAEQLRVTATVSQPGAMILRLRRYPAWQIELNGHTLAGLPQREDGLIAVPVAQGPVDLRIRWTTTPDVRAGRCVSFFALLLLGVLAWTERKLCRARLS